jgi:hypothetical protein
MLEKKSLCRTVRIAMTSCLSSVRRPVFPGLRTDPNLDGFTYADNEHDSIRLDKVILPRLSEDQQSLLQNIGYLGYDTPDCPRTLFLHGRNYALHDFGPCYRTEVALRALVMSEKGLRKYIEIHECAKKDQELAEQEKLKHIRRLRKKTILGLKLVGAAMDGSHPDYVQKIYQRWSEMLVFIESSEVWGVNS